MSDDLVAQMVEIRDPVEKWSSASFASFLRSGMCCQSTDGHNPEACLANDSVCLAAADRIETLERRLAAVLAVCRNPIKSVRGIYTSPAYRRFIKEVRAAAEGEGTK